MLLPRMDTRFLKSFLQACANCAQYYRGKPRRVIRKPRHLIHDYVCRLFSAAAESKTLKCHLCLHPPFSCRKLWKGHLFVVHGMKSARTREIESKPPTNVSAPIETVHRSSKTADVVFEDISEDEGEKPDRRKGGECYGCVHLL